MFHSHRAAQPGSVPKWFICVPVTPGAGGEGGTNTCGK